jgi:diguanylate cyclase (GGDEF)-like protein
MFYLALLFYSLSFVAQLATAALSISLIKHARHYRLGWIFLGIATSLMLGRRISPILFAINTGHFNMVDAALAVPISGCLFFGVLGIRKLLTDANTVNEKLKKMIRFDYLTNALSRQETLERAELEIQRSIRSHRPIALLSLDIDHFKNINDQWGHNVGDEVLKGLVRFIKAKIREVDFVGRVGGEEFLILLPETNEIEAMQVAERLRVGLSHFVCCHHLNHEIKLTVSIGVAMIVLDKKTGNYTDLLQTYMNQADEAMYAAKKSGRNQCHLFKPNSNLEFIRFKAEKKCVEMNPKSSARLVKES